MPKEPKLPETYRRMDKVLSKVASKVAGPSAVLVTGAILLGMGPEGGSYKAGLAVAVLGAQARLFYLGMSKTVARKIATDIFVHSTTHAKGEKTQSTARALVIGGVVGIGAYWGQRYFGGGWMQDWAGSALVNASMAGVMTGNLISHVQSSLKAHAVAFPDHNATCESDTPSEPSFKTKIKL